MKHSATLILVVAATVAGCTSSSTVTASPDPVKCQVALAAPSIVDAAGGSGSLAITTQPECAWEGTTTANWISGLSPASGQGTGTLAFRVAANESASTREAMIVVNGQQARVSQRAACRFDFGPANHSVSASGGAGSVNVATAADCAWTATTDVGWITLNGSISGSGNGTVNFSVAANGGSQRTGTITIAGQRSVVTQAAAGAPAPSPTPPAPTPSPTPPSPTPPAPTPPAPSCTYSISPSSHNFNALGGLQTVTMTTQAGCQWSAVSNAAWIVVVSGASGTGNGSAGVSVLPNLAAARTGTVTIGDRTFTATQAAVAPCEYSVSPMKQDVAAGSGTGSVNVSTTSNCSWTATSNASWLTITSGASGTGDGTVTFRYDANTGRKRKAMLAIAGRNAEVEQGER